MEDVIQLKGSMEMVLLNAYNGEVVERRKIDNTIVTAGRKWVLQQIASSDHVTAQSINYMAIGSDTTAAATSQSALGGETVRKAIGTFSTANLTSNPPSWQAQTSFATNEGNTTLAEVCLLNSSANGTMLGRAVFTTINKTTSNTLTISYTVSN